MISMLSKSLRQAITAFKISLFKNSLNSKKRSVQ
jgi:hypothetical protein